MISTGFLMATSRPSLSKLAIQGYWRAVRQLLQSEYGLNRIASQQAVLTYQAGLAKLGVLDAVYHASIVETAEGIVRGGYTPADVSVRIGQRAKRHQSTDERNS